MLAHILQRFLCHAQGHRLLVIAERVVRGMQVGRHLQRGRGAQIRCRLLDRAVEAELVQEGRPELADEAAQVVELPPQQIAQDADLGRRAPRDPWR